MRKFLSCMAIAAFLFGIVGFANAVVIDFAGGTAWLSGGTSVTTTFTLMKKRLLRFPNQPLYFYLSLVY